VNEDAASALEFGEDGWAGPWISGAPGAVTVDRSLDEFPSEHAPSYVLGPLGLAAFLVLMSSIGAVAAMFVFRDRATHLLQLIR
jgi:hypothetical protein